MFIRDEREIFERYIWLTEARVYLMNEEKKWKGIFLFISGKDSFKKRIIANSLNFSQDKLVIFDGIIQKICKSG